MTPHNALHTVVMSSVQAISLITGPIQVTRDAQIEPARFGNITLWSYNLVPNSSQAMIFFFKDCLSDNVFSDVCITHS